MGKLTEHFLTALCRMPTSETSQSALHQARACMLDFFGCSIAGAHFYGDKLTTLRVDFPEICINSQIGRKSYKHSILVAALINGINAHVIELDDGHRIGMLHVGAPVISALLAVAEKENITSQDFLLGIIMGYEVAIRLACAIQPGNKLRGYHATGTCGTVGATLGIATAMHFTKAQMKTALSAAVTSAAGVLEMQEDDSDLKPYNVGRAAMDAVMAAYIGKSGLNGPDDPLGGKRGFLNVMTDEPKMEYLTNFDSEKYLIETIYMKSYAACRHCHPSIEAAMNIRNQPGFDINEVEQIHVDTYKLAVAGHDHTDIKGVNSAKMSIPYSLAVALFTGKAGMDEFTERYISDSFIQSITDKVTVSDVDELTELCPQKRVAVVTVKTKSGDFTFRVDYPKGEPENPLTQEELEEKFRGLAMYGGLTREECDEVINEIWKDDFDLKKIMNIVCK